MIFYWHRKSWIFNVMQIGFVVLNYGTNDKINKNLCVKLPTNSSNFAQNNFLQLLLKIFLQQKEAYNIKLLITFFYQFVKVET